MRATARIKNHPIHPMLIVFPLAGGALAVVTDLVYVFVGNTFWAEASFWLITAAIVGAVAAALAGATDFITIREVNRNRHAWYHALLQVAGLLVFLADSAVRIPNRDLPGTLLFTGVTLTIIGAAIWGLGAWFGGDLVYVHHVGVVPEREETGGELRRAA